MDLCFIFATSIVHQRRRGSRCEGSSKSFSELATLLAWLLQAASAAVSPQQTLSHGCRTSPGGSWCGWELT